MLEGSVKEALITTLQFPLHCPAFLTDSMADRIFFAMFLTSSLPRNFISR